MGYNPRNYRLDVYTLLHLSTRSLLYRGNRIPTYTLATHPHQLTD